MTAYLVIFVFIGLGLALQQLDRMPKDAAQWLNQMAIYVCLPALILLHVPTLDPDLALLSLIIIPWSLLLVTVVCVLPLAKRMNWSREVTAVLLVLLPLGNTSFLGFPLTEALLGQGQLPLAVVYDQFGSFLMVSTYVLWVIAWYSTGTRPTTGMMLRRLVQFPPFVALVVAVIFGHHWMGAAGLLIAEALSKLLLPIVTVAIGLSLKLQLPKAFIQPLIFGVAAKLIALPVVAIGLLLGFGSVWPISKEVAQVAVLEASMPSMITAGALLSQARLAPELSSATVAWTVLLSVTTVPIWFWLSSLLWAV